MGILVEKDEDKSELSRRINADLRERAVRSSKQEDVDLVEESEYLKNTNKTNRFSWFWFILVFLAAVALVVIFIVS